MSRAFLHLGGKGIIFPHKFQTKSAFFSEAKILVKSDLFTNKTTPQKRNYKESRARAHARRILDKCTKTLTFVKKQNKNTSYFQQYGIRLNTLTLLIWL